MSVFYSGDVPAVIVLRVHRSGAHARVRVWIGQEGSPGLCGELMMRPRDWHLFSDCMAQQSSGVLQVKFEGDALEWLYPPADSADEQAWYRQKAHEDDDHASCLGDCEALAAEADRLVSEVLDGGVA